MEYLTDMVTIVPEGTKPVKVDELRAAEAVRASELAKAAHLARLWRPPLDLGEWRSIGLFRADDEAEQKSSHQISSSWVTCSDCSYRKGGARGFRWKKLQNSDSRNQKHRIKII